MKHRNLKARKIVEALKKFGCEIKRNTPHGVIVENPRNNKSINVPTHRDILAVWIYNNILRQLDIDKKEFEEYLD
jgi:5-enolpyruvylshikimate-3-phosphate synthase